MRSRFFVAIVFLAVLSSCYVPGRGYLESQFDLVLDSRLPKFFDPDGHISPRGYKARVEFYSSPHSVRVIIYEPSGRKVFDKHGDSWWHPKSQQPGQGKPQTYPSYEVVSFDGVLDIFEQRHPEPLLHLTDDAELWRTATPAPNQSMKPTAPWRNKFSVFATAPCRGLSLAR